MNRRDFVKIGASVAAAPCGLPAQQRDQPAWKPSLFDDHQNQTVIALIDLIIPATDTPGAKAALVNRHIDHLLNDGPEDERREFLEGLGWLDGYAIQKHGKPFIACAQPEQVAILEALDGGSEPRIAPGHRFFRQVKSLTARIYYATETGFKEMNKGGRVPSTFACTHPERA